MIHEQGFGSFKCENFFSLSAHFIRFIGMFFYRKKASFHVFIKSFFR